MSTFSIHITGKVQGIGFRPFVYRLACQLHLSGWVSNQRNGVHIRVTGEAKTVKEFYERLSAEAPPLANIQHRRLQRVAKESFESFEILQRPSGAAANLMLTPDLAMCGACRQEIEDSTNRRYRYAFTTCTSCGPRYSILAKLPYEREHTTMAPFAMCKQCEREYHDPENRRYYAQTNSCPQCPVSLTLYTAQQLLVSADQQEVIPAAVQFLQEGYIIAVKGIGGYLLLADATNVGAISTLRERKRRPSKPFALLYPDLDTARKDVYISEAEQGQLLAPEAPVVLAQKRAHPASGVQATLVAPGLDRLGLMLPYTPLFGLILSGFKKPVIATSANAHGSHIAFRDEDVFKQLAGIADYVLVHNRGILISQDDSVVQYTPRHHQKIMLRRSRGFAPSYVGAAGDCGRSQEMLAFGADLKSTFSLSASGNLYISQHLGDLSLYDNTVNFEHSLAHLMQLFHFRPHLILTDKHPAYASVRLGKKLAQQLAVPVVQVQHHEAHFAAVLSENKLLESPEPVLGVIWDGTGLGDDHLIRGGEFLLLENGHISPLAQVSPYPHLLGDKMALEPRIAAFALCHDLENAAETLRPLFTEAEWKLYRSLLQSGRYALLTTSMGRLFDAAAALLGLCRQNSYEGEAAMLLEAVASREPDVLRLAGYTLGSPAGMNVPIKPILRQMLADIQEGVSPGRIAAKFHVTLVDIIRSVANPYALKRIAFSGGVFQNSLLLDLIVEKLSPDYELYFHRQLPPNDECLSMGQLSWMHLKHIQADREQEYSLAAPTPVPHSFPFSSCV